MIKNKGFSLAEVLITMGIIGVVVVMVIPIIQSAAFEHDAVSKVKRNFSVLSQAIALYNQEESCVGDPNICIKAYNWRDCRNSFAGVEKNLPVISVKYNEPGITAWMRQPNSAYGLDGSINNYAYYVGGSDAANTSYCNYALSDGSVLTVFHQGVQHSHIDFVLDINGIKKPNRVGKDIFHFFSGDGGWGGTNRLPQKKQLLYPYFGSPYGYVPTDVCVAVNEVCNPDDGRSPAAYVLKYNKLPDLTKLGYPASP